MAEQWMPGAVREPQPGGVTLNKTLPPRATWHITWDKVTDGAQPPMANVGGYLKRMGYCPHLMWNPFTGEIIQYYPANVGGRALNAWNEDGAVNIQIEVYFSPGVNNAGRAYQTVADTPAEGWDQILAWLDSHGIPRTWPMGAPKWQGNPRDVDIWNTRAGHYGHCNVPSNTHTDPGPMPGLGTAGTTPQSSTITPIPSFVDMDIDMATPSEVVTALMGHELTLRDGTTASLETHLVNLFGDTIKRTEILTSFDGKTKARVIDILANLGPDVRAIKTKTDKL